MLCECLHMRTESTPSCFGTFKFTSIPSPGGHVAVNLSVAVSGCAAELCREPHQDLGPPECPLLEQHVDTCPLGPVPAHRRQLPFLTCSREGTLLLTTRLRDFLHTWMLPRALRDLISHSQTRMLQGRMFFWSVNGSADLLCLPQHPWGMGPGGCYSGPHCVPEGRKTLSWNSIGWAPLGTLFCPPQGAEDVGVFGDIILSTMWG